MQIQKIVITVLFCVFSSATHLLANDSEISNQISMLESEAALKLYMCAMSEAIASNTFDTYGEKSPKTKASYAALDKARVNAGETIDGLVVKLRTQLQPASKAEEALKDFYTFWRAHIDTVNERTEKSTMALILEKLEKVRTEATW